MTMKCVYLIEFTCIEWDWTSVYKYRTFTVARQERVLVTIYYLDPLTRLNKILFSRWQPPFGSMCVFTKCVSETCLLIIVGFVRKSLNNNSHSMCQTLKLWPNVTSMLADRCRSTKLNNIYSETCLDELQKADIVSKSKLVPSVFIKTHYWINYRQ